MFKAKNIITATMAIMAVISVFAAPALAAKDLGEIAQGITEQANFVGMALVAIGAVLGVFSLVYGGLQLKKASNNRGDASVGKGFGAIAVGILLVSVVAFAASGSKTIFGDESAMSDRISSFE